MTLNTIIKGLLMGLVSTTLIFAQSSQDTDAIEKARQAKEAAEKAAAEAAAATEAAIEAAAMKAAKEAREEAKRKKEDEEARKLAEAQAAEEAELDAAASAAAEEAKRKMAAELGLEYDSAEKVESMTKESDESEESAAISGEEVSADEVIAKESLGYNIGVSGSFGFIQGNFFDNIPVGGSLVISTPWGFNLGGARLGLSATVGAYPAKHNSGESFTPLAIGLGGNLTLANLVFAEGHVGTVGDASGARGFAGVSLEKIMKSGLNLPFNLLLGAEGFVSSDLYGGSGTYWGGLAFRVDFGL